MESGEFKAGKSKIIYRGQEYKILEIKKLHIGGKDILFLKLPHKYSLWINADYVVKC